MGPLDVPARDAWNADAAAVPWDGARGRGGGVARRWQVSTGVATAGMAMPPLGLYSVSVLAPFLTEQWELSRAALGLLVSVMFGVAAGMSLVTGQVVDVVGERRGLLALATVMVGAMSIASLAQSYLWLVVAVALAGVGQALANPATNLLVAGDVPAERRGMAVGIKQSGVQFAALGSGLFLPAVAAAAGWRAGFGLATLLAVGLLLVVWWLVPRGHSAAGTRWRWARPPAWVIGLMVYSLLMGGSIATVTSYLPLYAVEQLELAGWVGGAALSLFGLAGIVARMWWGRWTDRSPHVRPVLVWLAAGAAVSVMFLLLAAAVSAGLVWLAALGVGATAAAANAIVMVAVLRKGGTGHAAGIVSVGFFAGFVVGPATFGLIADANGYAAAWCLTATGFAAAAALPVLLRRQVAV